MLDIDGLRKRYGDTVALDGVSLTVGDGELVGFVGANGAGKSTTMRIAMGLVAADAGRVTYRGEPLTFASRRRFGYMPEERGLYPKMRVEEQIAYFGELHGMTRAAATASARQLLDQMSVKAQPRDFVQALSLGNQQRVQLAAALVHDPDLLILDEPFSGLDPLGVDTMVEVIARRRATGTGVLFSSHQLELVERICDRVVIVRNGAIVAAGTLAELRGPAAREQLSVRVHADPQWVQDVPGARVVARDGVDLVLSLADPDDDQRVLAAATAAGRVERFAWREPTLAELYRETVSDPAGVAA